MKKRNIAWLSELSKKDTALAGGKGANLGEMYNLKLPVPPAFVVTTEAYEYFLDKTGIRQQIDDLLDKINVDDTKQLDDVSKEIKHLIISTQMPDDLRQEIIEAYDNLNVDLSAMSGSPNALAIMRSSREPIFVAVRSSATSEDSGEASFAGQQESFINVRGNPELIEAVKKVFASAFTPRSIFYKKKKGYKAHIPIAAVVQKMINSEKAGVMFSRNPVVRTNDNILVEAVFGQGEGIVSGAISPDSYVVSRQLEVLDEKLANKKIAIVRDASGITKTIQLTPEKSASKVLKTFEIKQLAEHAIKLEEHYQKPQDIEFAIADGSIYIVQTRPITTLEKKQEKAVELTGELLTKGMPASPGVGSGVVRIVRSMEDLEKIKQGDILVTTMTNPDMVVSMQKAAAIVTDEGGITSHAAIVSREMGIPAVVGTEDATKVLEDGQEVTVDGDNGKVYLGKTENKKKEVLPITVHTRTKIKVMVDLPHFAERASKANAFGVGLLRLEGIIANQKKHILWYEKNKKLDEYQEIIKKGILEISEMFVGKEIWIRTSDIRTDEFNHLEGAPPIERNPMLGDHGIRFSLKHPGLLKAELKAIKQLAEKGHKFGIMFPQIISPRELAEVKKIMKELNMLDNKNIKVGVMIETPAAVVLIKDILDEGIEFLSFGTNDLTQFTLAIDRGNDEVQYLYNELDWAIRKQLSRVIRECKNHKSNPETSICGQAGSNKEMVEYLVKAGIDSISVNADVAKDISELVKQVEDKMDSEKPEKTEKSEKQTEKPQHQPPQNHQHTQNHQQHEKPQHTNAPNAPKPPVKHESHHENQHHEKSPQTHNEQPKHEKTFIEKVEEKFFDVFS